MKRLLTIMVLVIALIAAVAASAAGITVLKTSFDNRAEYEAIRGLSGSPKQCKRDWRDRSALGVRVRGGPTECAVSTPVQGDADQPDQIVRVVAKVNKETDDKAKKTAYVGVIARASRAESYELRVFPKARTFELLKSGEVLEDGREKAIEGLAAKNRLQIDAIGATVTAKVNGTEVGSFRDEDAEQVEGRQTGLSFGNRGRAKKAQVVAVFDKLKVQVPVP